MLGIEDIQTDKWRVQTYGAFSMFSKKTVIKQNKREAQLRLADNCRHQTSISKSWLRITAAVCINITFSKIFLFKKTKLSQISSIDEGQHLCFFICRKVS